MVLEIGGGGGWIEVWSIRPGSITPQQEVGKGSLSLAETSVVLRLPLHLGLISQILKILKKAFQVDPLVFVCYTVHVM
jgi:hypothetical protein